MAPVAVSSLVVLSVILLIVGGVFTLEKVWLTRIGAVVPVL